MSDAPFRSADLETQVRALRERRGELAARLLVVRSELAALRPWRWSRFALGLLLGPGLVMIASMIASLIVSH